MFSVFLGTKTHYLIVKVALFALAIFNGFIAILAMRRIFGTFVFSAKTILAFRAMNIFTFANLDLFTAMIANAVR